jgi:hypothetical protein
MIAAGPISEGKREACKTYLEQTKLLVTLASAFLFAPAGLIAILKDRLALKISAADLCWFVVAEALFIVSVLAGYVAIGSVTGSQDSEAFDVFRPATRIASLVQFGFYLLGIIVFVALAVRLLKHGLA